MTVADFTFYVFAIAVIAGGLLTVVSRNPVHSVLWLILSFLSSAGLFVLPLYGLTSTLILLSVTSALFLLVLLRSPNLLPVSR